MSVRGYLGAAIAMPLLAVGFVVGAVIYTIELALTEGGDPWNG